MIEVTQNQVSNALICGSVALANTQCSRLSSYNFTQEPLCSFLLFVVGMFDSGIGETHVNSFLSGLSDTLLLFRPRCPGKNSYGLTSHYRDDFKESFPAYDAAADVAALGRLRCSSEMHVIASAVTCASVTDIMSFGLETEQQLASFTVPIEASHSNQRCTQWSSPG